MTWRGVRAPARRPAARGASVRGRWMRGAVRGGRRFATFFPWRAPAGGVLRPSPLALLLAVVLALSGLATLSPVARAADPEIAIPGFSYSPARLEVDPGATVSVVNRDAAPHSVRHAAFDSGVLDQDERGSFAAPATPGEYAYVCGVHGGSMRGTLVVRGAPASSTPEPAPSTPTPPSPTPSPAAASPTATLTPATPAPVGATASAPTAAASASGPAAPPAETPMPGPLALVGLVALAALLLRRRG